MIDNDARRDIHDSQGGNCVTKGRRNYLFAVHMLGESVIIAHEPTQRRIGNTMRGHNKIDLEVIEIDASDRRDERGKNPQIPTNSIRLTIRLEISV